MNQNYSVAKDSQLNVPSRARSRSISPGPSSIRIFGGRQQQDRIRILEEALEREYMRTGRSPSSQIFPQNQKYVAHPSRSTNTSSQPRIEVSQQTVVKSGEPVGGDFGSNEDAATLQTHSEEYAEELHIPISESLLAWRQRQEEVTLRIPGPRDAENGRRPEEVAEKGDVPGADKIVLKPRLTRPEHLAPAGIPQIPESKQRRITLASRLEAQLRVKRGQETKSPGAILVEERHDIEAGISFNSQEQASNDTVASYTDILLSRSEVLNLPETLTRDVLRGLVYPLTTIHNRQRLVVNLAQLQQLNLQHLRLELAQEVSSLIGSRSMGSEDSARIRGLMSEYCNTLRDWDYMSEKHTPEIEKDPFKLVSSQTRDACIIEDVHLHAKASIIWDSSEYDPIHKKQRVPDDFNSPSLVGGSRALVKERKEAELFALRLWFSLIGGVALIAPVVFMVLYKGKGENENAPLITTAVSTILFAVVMAKFSTQPPWNLVATTAAYAAVLVVFVGSSTSSSG